MNRYRNKMVGTDMNKKTNGSLARFPFSFLKNYPIKKNSQTSKTNMTSQPMGYFLH